MTTDTYWNQPRGVTFPAGNAGAIRSGGTGLSGQTRTIHAGTGDDAAVRMVAGDPVGLRNVPDRALLPVRIDRVPPAAMALHLVEFRSRAGG